MQGARKENRVFRARPVGCGGLADPGANPFAALIDRRSSLSLSSIQIIILYNSRPPSASGVPALARSPTGSKA